MKNRDDVTLGRRLTAEEVKEKQLEILDVVLDFCKKHEIKCFLEGGTLLGAVRHQGYIPWDDDIDIGMLRSDYERFLREYQADSTQRFYLKAPELDRKWPLVFAKVCDPGSSVIEDNKIFRKQPVGVNIDIFALDGFPRKNPFARHFLVDFYHYGLVSKYTMLRNTSIKRPIWWQSLFGKILFCLVPYPVLVQKSLSLAKSYEHQQPEIISEVVYGPLRCFCSPLAFEKVVYLPFEKRECPCPEGYREFLTAVFGDYMIPPLEKHRINHNVEAYIKELV